MTRIDINGQRGFCDTELTVSRSMPAVLSDRMPYSSWNSFCDKIDEALLPAKKAKKCSVIFIVLFMSFFIGMVILSFVSFSNFGSGSSSSMPSFIPFMILFVVMAAGMIGLACLTWSVRNQIEEGLSKVCSETSATHSGISFHVRKEHYITGHSDNLRKATLYYLEVSVSNTTTGTTLPVAQGYVAPSAPVAPPAPALTAFAVAEPEAIGTKGAAGNKTPAERMGELDQMKGLLSEDEYEQKRAEILSDV